MMLRLSNSAIDEFIVAAEGDDWPLDFHNIQKSVAGYMLYCLAAEAREMGFPLINPPPHHPRCPGINGKMPCKCERRFHIGDSDHETAQA